MPVEMYITIRMLLLWLLQKWLRIISVCFWNNSIVFLFSNNRFLHNIVRKNTKEDSNNHTHTNHHSTNKKGIGIKLLL